MSKTKRVDSKGRKLRDGFSERKGENRYIARFTVAGKQYTMYGKNLADLEKAVAIRRGDLEKGVLEPEKIVLNEWFTRWLDSYKKDQIRNQTYVNYRTYYDWYVKESLGHMQLCKIKKTHVVELCKGLLNRKDKKPLSINTVKYICSLLFCCLEEAADNELIGINPARNVMNNLLHEDEEENKRDSLTVQEERVFCKYISKHRFFKCHENMMGLLFKTGMRVGEMCALTWEDVDLDNGIIRINKTLGYRKASVTEGRVKSIGPTKTKRSKRDIPIMPDVRELLINQQIMLEISHRKCKETINGFTNFVFLSEDGTALYPDYVTAIIKKIISSYNKKEEEIAKKEDRTAVLLPPFSAHWFRHTFRSRCFAKGMRNETVHGIMGHTPRSNVSETTYLHIPVEVMEQELRIYQNN